MSFKKNRKLAWGLNTGITEVYTRTRCLCCIITLLVSIQAERDLTLLHRWTWWFVCTSLQVDTQQRRPRIFNRRGKHLQSPVVFVTLFASLPSAGIHSLKYQKDICGKDRTRIFLFLPLSFSSFLLDFELIPVFSRPMKSEENALRGKVKMSGCFWIDFSVNVWRSPVLWWYQWGHFRDKSPPGPLGSRLWRPVLTGTLISNLKKIYM